MITYSVVENLINVNNNMQFLLASPVNKSMVEKEYGVVCGTLHRRH